MKSGILVHLNQSLIRGLFTTLSNIYDGAISQKLSTVKSFYLFPQKSFIIDVRQAIKDVSNSPRLTEITKSFKKYVKTKKIIQAVSLFDFHIAISSNLIDLSHV